MSNVLMNLAADPELNIINSETGDLVPGSIVLEKYFKIKGINLGDEFNVSNDPNYEFLMKRKTRNTKVGPVHNLLPVDSDFQNGWGDYPYGSLVIDGTAIEINVQPVTCRRHLVMGFASSINAIQSILDTLNNNGHDLQITVEPTVMLTQEVLDSLPKQAAIFGCDADVDIYNRVSSECSVDASKHPFRYAGGHLHMSFNRLPDEKYGDYYLPELISDLEKRKTFLGEYLYEFTQLFDRLIGISTTAINHSIWESMRRDVYGQAGRVRLQPYGGIEYRTPSSSWLLHPSLVSYVFFFAQAANNVFFMKDIREEIENICSIEEIVSTINGGDHKTAMEILETSFQILKKAESLTPSDEYLSDDIIDYARHMYSSGGTEEVFSNNDVAKVWSSNGILPAYGDLGGVDDFVAHFPYA